MYGWPIFVGFLCFVVANQSKGKAALLGAFIGSGCLLGAVVFSRLSILAIETWIIPVSYSRECSGEHTDCPTWLLETGEVILEWQFLVLEGVAVLVAV